MRGKYLNPKPLLFFILKMASKESSLGLFSLSNKRKQSNGLKSHKRGKLQGGKKELKGAKSGKNEVVIEASNIGKEVKSEDSHYVKTLQKALKEVVDENDVVSLILVKCFLA